MVNKLLQTLIILGLLGILGERSWAAYQWKQRAEEAQKLAIASANYLFTDTEVKKDGKAVTRAQLLDMVLAEVLKNTAAAQQQK